MPTLPTTHDLRRLFAPENRGRLLDAVVFLFNLTTMLVLSHFFVGFMRADHSSLPDRLLLFLYFLCLIFLQPLGALLKRRGAHSRKPDLSRPQPGCLFHPFFYFLSKLVFLIAAAGSVVDFIYGDAPAAPSADYFGLPPWLFTTLFLGVPALAVLDTAASYFYFWRPKRAPLFNWLESPRAESLADVLLFVNMIGYQLFWALLMADVTKDYSGVFGRLFTFCFAALLIYLPPRLFYLAEDGDRPATWWMMLLANSPVLVRIFFSR